VTRDDRERLTRVVLGDAPADSGELGSLFSLAGVTYRREFRMDPNLVYTPTAGIRGSTRYPAELTVWVDNVQVASERIPPGPFELRDFTYYGGAGEMRVVLKDAFGREEEVRTPFYFTDAVLKEGFQDYSFQAGLLRKEGAEGDEGYSDPAFSFYHRRGLTDELTFGVRGEGAASRFNGGVTAARKVGVLGVLGAALAAGTDGEGGVGVAGYVSYSYQDRHVSFRSSLEGRSEGYGTAGDEAGTGTKARAAVGAGYTSPGLGSLSADFFTVSRYGEGSQSVVSLSALRSVGRRLDLQGGYRYTDGVGEESQVFLFATYRLGTDCTASLRVAAGDGGSREEAEIRKNVPLGEGYGYSMRVAREDRDGNDSTLFLPSGRYNGRAAVLAGDVESRSGEGSGTVYRLGAAGSLLHAGGEFLLSRPVYDSFGVATAGGVPGVTVYQNGQPIGPTDERGRVVLPNLNSYYENQVALDDKEIPIEYSVREVTRYVSPPYRSGTVVPFEVTRLQAITGYLDIMVDGAAVPAEYAEASIEGAKDPVPTGKGGEIYLENLPPGGHEGTLELGGRKFRFRLVVPDTKEFIVELGRIACEPLP
jgi:outer membrane usher protein